MIRSAVGGGGGGLAGIVCESQWVVVDCRSPGSSRDETSASRRSTPLDILAIYQLIAAHVLHLLSRPARSFEDAGRILRRL
jgi:hypothetical protein